jgi:formate C-acetyltransferase
MAKAAASQSALRIPGLAEPLSGALSAPLQALRERALQVQRGPCPGIPEITLADARAWQAHTPDEDWLTWRARRCAERLRALPFELEAGEVIIGKPRFRAPTPAEELELQKARAILSTVPPFPGGDPGHFHPDYETLLRLGVPGLLCRVRDLRGRPGITAEQRVFYDACGIVMEGLAVFIDRAAAACLSQAAATPSEARRWTDLALVCRGIASGPPRTFHEAIQLLFLTEIALWFAEDHGLASPGRLDRTLLPFYVRDLASGETTPERAFELICCLYIHMNRILWPGSAVAVMVGGRDAAGRDITNDLTYLCLAARATTRLVYPTVGLAWHPDTPDELMDFSLRLLATGLGDPALFNDDLIAEGLRDHGVRPEDLRNYMNSTCVEIKVVGTSNMWVTAPYFNCPQALLDVLGQIARGASAAPASFADLRGLVRERLTSTVSAAARSLDAVWNARAERGCFPLASCLIRDCLERGMDFDRGGARYHWVENSFVGLANLVDSLLAIQVLVFDEQALTLADLQAALQADFAGHEPLRQRLLNGVPKYGNDDARADALARDWADFLSETTEAQSVGGHRYVPGFFCWVMHERLGSQTGATPDGRHAGTPLADGAGAAQGRELSGPTAAVLSTTCWSHRKALGGLVHNLKFSRTLLDSAAARRAARTVIETYLRRGGFEIQVNVVGRETLLAAQARPELYQDLLVRVAGYSDYFVHLNRATQDEVIARNEHAVG